MVVKMMRVINFALSGILVVGFEGAVTNESPVKVCGYPVDVMFLMDTTGSMSTYFDYLQKELIEALNDFDAYFPGTRSGVAEFRDKPYWSAGLETDTCYNLPEGGSLTANHFDTIAVVNKLGAYGGGDLKEDHYQAALNAALDQRVHWRPIINSGDQLSARIRQLIADGQEAQVKSGDEVIARIIIWLTDATPQYQGNMDGKSAPKELPPNEGTIIDGDLSKACLERDFLAPELFAKIMKQDNVFDLLAVHVAESAHVWQWVNEQLLKQPASYITEMDTTPQGLLKQAIRALVEKCPESAVSTVTPQVETTTSRTRPPLPSPTRGSTIPSQGR